MRVWCRVDGPDDVLCVFDAVFGGFRVVIRVDRRGAGGFSGWEEPSVGVVGESEVDESAEVQHCGSGG